MALENNFDIKTFLSLEGYNNEERETRRRHNSNSKPTAEFFTPYSIVKSMCDKVDASIWSNPTKTFVEPSFGNGQFILMILYKRLQHGIDWCTAIKTCYGVELMEDNVEECKQRVCGMLSQLCEDFNKRVAMRIMNKNFVCHDFFTWDFEEWRPMTEEVRQK